MKTQLINFILTYLFIIPSFGQEAQKYFEQINKIVAGETVSRNLYNKLDSLQAKKIPSRSGISKYLDRDLDFGYKHQRINIQINFENFRVDLLTSSDSVLLSVISHNDYKKLQATYYTEAPVLKYLTLRNNFYGSNKKIKDLEEEISSNITYAFYCGDGLPKTDEGKQIERLVNTRSINKLNEMLNSINIETQTYGVAGFKMLSKKAVIIAKEQEKIIKYIKKRNSEVVTCSGCLTGLVEKIY
jgi:hypothetical protein